MNFALPRIKFSKTTSCYLKYLDIFRNLKKQLILFLEIFLLWVNLWWTELQVSCLSYCLDVMKALKERDLAWRQPIEFDSGCFVSISEHMVWLSCSLIYTSMLWMLHFFRGSRCVALRCWERYEVMKVGTQGEHVIQLDIFVCYRKGQLMVTANVASSLFLSLFVSLSELLSHSCSLSFSDHHTVITHSSNPVSWSVNREPLLNN